ncbi:Polysaccharide pyruvyl transferase family protein [Cryptosporidium meleagridis]|uniref:Polysaccharide pyruvyl transferase family protein n=1 Tax=Cryptosporidium meleagridis TaxID=93969 RepID=A0A2P4YYA7_9CRYT|nr:Polysaccharide pyruvyl transferase family protein [Cryptosporidium meleagridis]
MEKFAINANRKRVIKGITIETLTILGWTVGSALHSIFTKKSFNKLSKDEPISSRIIFGSFLTIVQLLLASVTGILICGIISVIHRRKIKQDSVELVNNRISVDGNDSNIEGSITESTCENRFEQTDFTQISKSSSYIIDGDNIEISKEKTEFNEFDTNLNMDENANISYLILNKDYNLNTFNRNIDFPEASFEIGSNYENELKKDKLITSTSNRSQKNSYKKQISKERWWGSNKMLLSAALYAIANICANTALGGGKVMLVQIIKCSELILTAILAFFVLKRKVTVREVIAFSISTVGIILVVTSTLSNGNAGSKVIVYSVILAGVGAFTISLRNVIVSSANKNEKAVDTFTILSFWGMITSLTIFSIMSIAFGGFNINVSVMPLLISGCFHATYNFSSLAFLKLVGSPIVHAYFNLAKRAIIVLTAELINCTAPPIVQIFGSILAILGIHFSKKRKLSFKSKKKIASSYVNEIQNKNTDFNDKVGKVIKEQHKESKIENKDKYPYAASIAISSLFIIIGWITSYTCSCVLPKKSLTHMGEVKHRNSSFIDLEKNSQKFDEIKKIFEIDNWFNNYPELLIYLSEKRPELLSQSMRKYTRISDNFFAQGEIMMSILNYTIGNVENGIVFGIADHENKGDAGINWSQYLVFKRLNIKIIYYCTSNYFHKPCDIKRALNIANSLPLKPTIFLTGGGNLGDVWPKYENERKKVLEEFHEFNTVIFPQSISLKSKDTIMDFDYLKMHKNLTIFVRDIYSFSFLHSILFNNQSTTNTKLLLTPDIVTSIVTTKEKKSPNITKHLVFNEIYDILWINRNDRETRQWNKNYDTNLNIKVDDWIKFMPTTYSKGISYGNKYILKSGEEIAPPLFVPNVFNSTYEYDEPNFDVFSIGISLQRFCAGLNFILQGKVIITNRLHGHIFSSLLKKNQILLDTKYKKILNYYKTWRRCIEIGRRDVKISK